MAICITMQGQLLHMFPLENIFISTLFSFHLSFVRNLKYHIITSSSGALIQKIILCVPSFSMLSLIFSLLSFSLSLLLWLLFRRGWERGRRIHKHFSISIRFCIFISIYKFFPCTVFLYAFYVIRLHL